MYKRLSTMGNIFSREHFEIFFLYFPEKRFLIEAICMKSCLKGKIRLMSTICRLLN